MSHPANLAVIRDNRRELYRDRGCATELDIELFWGPELALPYIRGRWPVDEWYEEYHCDAGVVLDCDRRHMTFYNGDICEWIPGRRALLPLVEYTWRGWDVRWAHGGLSDLCAAAGIPPSKYVPLAPAHQSEGLHHWTNLHHFLDVLTLNVRGSVRGYRIEPSMPPPKAGFWNEYSGLMEVFDRDEDLLDQWSEGFPTGGVHVNVDRKQIWFWHSLADEFAERRVRHAFSEWEVTWLKDRFEEHMALSEGLFQPPPLNLHREREKIFEEIEAFTRRGWHKSVGSLEEKLRILEEVRREFS